MNKKLKILIIIIVIAVLAYTTFYFTEYNPAEQIALDCLNGSENVTVTQTNNQIFLDGPGNDTALIFYPGAKNEYTSYLPLLMNLANNGIDTYIMEMPLNMPFFGEYKADETIDNTNYTHYIMSGHSLGGLIAASYMNHTGKGDALVLISAYPVTQVEKPVLSIYGSEDGILNMEAYEDSKKLMSNFTEYVIEGGNHAQFAYYGLQDNDGVSTITPENQQQQTLEKIIEFANNITNHH